MEWRDLKFSVDKKEIIKGVSGLLNPGHVTAVMGPSGCGKTTLLNILSGRQRSSGKQKGKTTSQRVELKGTVTVRGEAKKPKHFQKLVAYVFQDNALPEFETPRDCLTFSAFLRLPSTMNKKERKAVVQTQLERLRLEQCADIIVGSVTRKGLSGGEQKRTAVGIELISKPKMVFLDEPLSGLDSFNACSLMQSLRDLAASGVPVLLTLHQPSSEIFALIDDLIVMHEGEVCYHGPADMLAAHFEVLGFPCPEGWGPTCHAMSVIQNEEADVVQHIKDKWRTCGPYQSMMRQISVMSLEGSEQAQNEDLVSDSEDSDEETSSSDDDTSHAGTFGSSSGEILPPNKHQKGCCTTLAALLNRDLRKTRRTFWLFMSTYVLQGFCVGIIYGLFFFGTGRAEQDPSHPSCNSDDFSSTQCRLYFLAHFKFMSMLGFCIVFASVPYAIETLQTERSVFLRERAGGYYEVVPYFFSKMVFEVPQVFLQAIFLLVATYFLVGLRGNFFWLLLELMVLSMTSSSLMYVFSAACSTPDKANGYATLPMTLQFAFSGVLIPIKSMPLELQWVKWICPLYYGLNLLGTTEFHYVWKGMYEHCDMPDVFSSSPLNATAVGTECVGFLERAKMLEAYSIRPTEFFWPNLAMCGVMILGFRTVASIFLWRQSRYVH